MLDVAYAYNRFKFLGDEFLTWLWFMTDKDPATLQALNPDLASLTIGSRMVLENRRQKALETLTIKGDDANLEEALLALRKGALVTELNLKIRLGAHEWAFTIKGESLNLSGFKTPVTAAVETPAELEGAVIEKAYLYSQALQVIDQLFHLFVAQRVAPDWQRQVVPRIKKWIRA